MLPGQRALTARVLTWPWANQPLPQDPSILGNRKTSGSWQSLRTACDRGLAVLGIYLNHEDWVGENTPRQMGCPPPQYPVLERSFVKRGWVGLSAEASLLRLAVPLLLPQRAVQSGSTHEASKGMSPGVPGKHAPARGLVLQRMHQPHLWTCSKGRAESRHNWGVWWVDGRSRLTFSWRHETEAVNGLDIYSVYLMNCIWTKGKIKDS